MAVAFLLGLVSLAAGSFAVARRALPGSDAEVVAGGLLLALFVALGMMRALGALGLLNPIALTLAPVALGLVLGSRAGWDQVAALRIGVRGGGLSAFAWTLGAVLVGGLLLQAWLYRTTAWDALWYHSLMTHWYVLQGSTAWLDVGVDYASGYPNAVELLAAWPCAVLRTTTFDDVGQIPFGLAGAALVAAWSRRTGATHATPVVAACWLAMPPVLLQMTSNLNDVAEAVSLAATVWFLFVGPHTPARSWWVLMAASLAFAAKGTGIVLLAPLAPFLVWNQLRGAHAGRLGLELPTRLGLLLFIGLYKPIEDWMHTGNPLWPFRNQRLGFEGPVDPADFTWNGMHGIDCFFFSGEGDFARMLTSWYDLNPGYEPNLTSGGFGPIHAFLGVPAIAFAMALILSHRVSRTHRWPLLVAILLFVLGLMGPNPWWPRHILASSAASMVILGAMLGRLRPAVGKAVGVGALATAAVFAFAAASEGIESYREHGLLRPLRMGAAERSTLASGPLWPAEMIERRNATFGPNDVLAYERAVWLHTQFIPWNYGSRALWIEPEGDARQYMDRLHSAHVRWVVLRTGRWRAGLEALGAVELYQHNDEVVLEVPP